MFSWFSTLITTILILMVLASAFNTNRRFHNETYLAVKDKIEQGIGVQEMDVSNWATEVLQYNLNSIHSLEEVYAQLELLAACPYGHVKLQHLSIKKGRARLPALTYQGNHLPYLNISVGAYVQKPAIVVVAGVHGKDWLGVAAIMNLVSELVYNYDKSYKYTNKITWIAIPILNPDGYSATLSDENMRNWIKNMFVPDTQQEPGCFGVDLSLNFEYQWLNYIYENASWCDEHYTDKPFSQNESRALKDTMRDHLDTIKIFVSIKQNKRRLMYPFRYSKVKPLFWESYEQIVKVAAKAAYEQHYRKFEYGHVLEFETRTAGGVDDWISAHLGVSLGFTFEVSDWVNNSIKLPAREILWTNQETFAALKVIAMMGIEFNEKDFLPSINFLNGKGTYTINSYLEILSLILALMCYKLQIVFIACKVI